MKVRADENVSPKIIQALRIVSLSAGWELTGVREAHGARTLDETWVPRFAAEGGHAIITADAHILRRPHLIGAIQHSGVRGLILPPAWAQARRHVQASSLIYFWPQIEAAFAAGQPGDFWRLPTTLHNGDLERMTVNYAAAARANQSPRP